MGRYKFIAAYLLIHLAVVLTDRKDIRIDIAMKSWMSTENLGALINASFTSAKCCNAFLLGDSAGVEQIFNMFVRIYPLQYTLNNRMYACDSYFMMLTTPDGIKTTMKNIPTTIASTELLIIIDSNVDESMEVFNVPMYEYANVHIVTPNGLWILSENFLEPRVFRRMSSHHAIKQKQDLVNLQGRQLQAMAYWQPPFCYLQTTANLTINGITREYYVAENQKEVDGVEMKLFMIFAEQLNFTWKILTTSNDDKYGNQNGSSWEGGMIGKILRKEVDMAFTSIWLTEDKHQFINMTQPWAMLHIHFMVPRPKPYTSFWALTRPLSPEVWTLIVVMLIILSIYVHLRAKFSANVPKRFRSFAVTWTELLGRLVGSWAPQNIKGFKIEFQVWHFAGLLLVTAYSSSLASRLTNWRYEKRIDTAQDFITSNLSWGDEYFVPSMSNIFDNSDPWAKQYALHFQVEADEEDRHRKMMQGNYAVLGNIIGSSFFPLQFVRNEDLKFFRVMKNSIAQYYSSFVVQPWLLRSMDKLMFRLHAAGLVSYHLENVLHRRTGSALREVLHEHDGYEGIPRVLKLNPLGAGFAILIIGLTISTVMFYFELRSVSSEKTIRGVLLGIRKKRQLWRATDLSRRRQRLLYEKLQDMKLITVCPPNREWMS